MLAVRAWVLRFGRDDLGPWERAVWLTGGLRHGRPPLPPWQGRSSWSCPRHDLIAIQLRTAGGRRGRDFERFNVRLPDFFRSYLTYPPLPSPSKAARACRFSTARNSRLYALPRAFTLDWLAGTKPVALTAYALEPSARKAHLDRRPWYGPPEQLLHGLVNPAHPHRSTFTSREHRRDRFIHRNLALWSR